MASGTINTSSINIKNANNVTSISLDVTDSTSGYGAMWFLTGRHYQSSTIYGAIGVFSVSNNGAIVLCSNGLTDITASISYTDNKRLLTISWTNSISYAKLTILRLSDTYL